MLAPTLFVRQLALTFILVLRGTTPAGAAQDAAPTPIQTGTAVVLHHEDVLGTSLRLDVVAPPEQVAPIESAVLAEIERLRLVLSSWDAASEFSALPVGSPTPASADLRAALTACEQWTKATRGAFDPKVAAYTEVWTRAQVAGTLPSDDELATVERSIAGVPFEIDAAAGTVTRRLASALCLDGLAKGYILDAAAGVARAAGATAGLLDIGGDLIVFGEHARDVAIADPHAPADNAPPLEIVALARGAVATSGGYARGFDIAGRHFSHIVDPRSGRPVERVLQATVVAPDATTADALATAFNVLDPRESLKICQRTDGVQALILTANGGRYESPGWAALVVPGSARRSQATSALAAGGEVTIVVELATIESGGGGKRRGGYKRPYLAVWLENGRGEAVRTLTLWIERPRWVGDLREWSRAFDEQSEPVRAVTRATRGPGRYTLVFDGRDEQGAPLPAGTYTLLVEAVREHGGYQVASQELVLDGRAFHLQTPAGKELGPVSIDYDPPSRP